MNRPLGTPIREPFSYRTDPEVPRFRDDRAIIIFDGHCGLCSGLVRFILRQDRKDRFRLLPAQTPLGHPLYVHYGLNPREYETNILIEEGVVWFKSEGSIRLAERLGFPWSLIAALRLLPVPMRDGLYGILARNRLRWFGTRQACFLPDVRYADRFLK